MSNKSHIEHSTSKPDLRKLVEPLEASTTNLDDGIIDQLAEARSAAIRASVAPKRGLNVGFIAGAGVCASVLVAALIWFMPSSEQGAYDADIAAFELVSDEDLFDLMADDFEFYEFAEEQITRS